MTKASHGGGVVVVGSVNHDVTLFVGALPQPGETLMANHKIVSIGGKGANQAVAASYQGVETQLVAVVGDDGPGREAMAQLSRKRVSLDYLQVFESASTGSAIILVGGTGENMIVVDPAANSLLSAEHVRRGLEASQAAVCVAQLEVPLDTIETAAKSFAGTFILNPAPVTSRVNLADVLTHTDILIPNRAELAGIVGCAEPKNLDEVVAAVRLMPFDGAVVVTLGADGALLFPRSPRSDPHHVPAVSTETLDTSGAGDVFCGTFAAGLSTGLDMESAAVHANRVAAWSVTQKGAQLSGGLPGDLRLAA